MFVLNSDITVAGKHFGGVHEVVVKRSIHTLAATALIKVPVTAVLRSAESVTRIETAQAIQVGDAVEIRLGYNGQMETEFRGYVKQLNYKTPLEIECEDTFFQCRSRSVNHSGKTTLKALLEKCGLDIGYCESLTITEFPVPDQKTKSDKVSTVLNRLKSKYLLSLFFDLEGKIYACCPGSIVGNVVKYEFRRNTISDDDLVYHRKEDVKIMIRAAGIKRDGTSVEVTAGTEGATETKLEFYDIADRKELEMIAAAELERRSYDGYSGTITTFLQPYAAPGMVADIADPMYPQRNGRYFIESVETTFGTGGGRRKIEIGIKV